MVTLYSISIVSIDSKLYNVRGAYIRLIMLIIKEYTMRNEAALKAENEFLDEFKNEYLLNDLDTLVTFMKGDTSVYLEKLDGGKYSDLEDYISIMSYRFLPAVKMAFVRVIYDVNPDYQSQTYFGVLTDNTVTVKELLTRMKDVRPNGGKMPIDIFINRIFDFVKESTIVYTGDKTSDLNTPVYDLDYKFIQLLKSKGIKVEDHNEVVSIPREEIKRKKDEIISKAIIKERKRKEIERKEAECKEAEVKAVQSVNDKLERLKVENERLKRELEEAKKKSKGFFSWLFS